MSPNPARAGNGVIVFLVFVAAIGALMLYAPGCAKKERDERLAPIPEPKAVEVNHPTGRFTVQAHGAIADWGRTREIYIITDNVTGVEYLGIVGVGTSQLVTRGGGKTSRVEEE